MGVFSIPAALLGAFLQDGTQIQEKGFLFGFDMVVWFTAFWYGIGGLSVAVCIKYADNIAKNFATSVAIILATIGSIYIFNFQVYFFGKLANSNSTISAKFDVCCRCCSRHCKYFPLFQLNCCCCPATLVKGISQLLSRTNASFLSLL